MLLVHSSNLVHAVSRSSYCHPPIVVPNYPSVIANPTTKWTELKQKLDCLFSKDLGNWVLLLEDENSMIGSLPELDYLNALAASKNLQQITLKVLLPSSHRTKVSDSNYSNLHHHNLRHNGH